MHLDDDQVFHRYRGEEFSLTVSVAVPETITDVAQVTGAMFRTASIEKTQTDMDLSLSNGTLEVLIPFLKADTEGVETDTYLAELMVEFEDSPSVVTRALFILDRSLTLEASE